MNTLSAIVAINQPGTVGSSSIFQAGVAERMIAQSQENNAQYLRKKSPSPAAIIHINCENKII